MSDKKEVRPRLSKERYELLLLIEDRMRELGVTNIDTNISTVSMSPPPPLTTQVIPPKQKKFTEPGLYLLLGCVHAPAHNVSMMNGITNLIIDQKSNLKGFVLMGDFLDMNTLSGHDTGRFTAVPGLTLVQEYEAGEKLLSQLTEPLSDNTSKVFLYGNHCYDKETKFLTKHGFKSFDELTLEDEVGQFDDTMKISFDKPVRFIKHRYTGKLYDFSTLYTRQVVTDLHDVVLKDGDGILKVKANKITSEDLFKIPQQVNYSQPAYPISEDWLRLLTWVVCDATLVDQRKYDGETSVKRRVQFKLSKQRKIDRLTALLDRIGIPYTLKICKKGGLNKLQPYYIRLYGDSAREIFKQLNEVKKFPEWFSKLNKYQSLAVIDEISHTDGNVHDGGVSWVSTSKEDMDTIQIMALNNGILFNYKESNQSGFADGKQQYRARINTTDGGARNGNKLTSYHYNDFVYCVEMPLGTVITQRGGKIGLSGNCDRHNRYMSDMESSKRPLPSPIEGLGLVEKGFNVFTNWKDDHVTLGEHLDVFHGQYYNVHCAKKTIDTFRGSVVFVHSHRVQSYIEGRTGGFNIGWGGDVTSPFFNYMPRGTKSMWQNGFAMVNISETGDYYLDQIIHHSGRFYYGGKKYN